MDKKSLSLLKLLGRKGELTYDAIVKKLNWPSDVHPNQNVFIDFLTNQGYIKFINPSNVFYNIVPPSKAMFEITRKGREYLENQSKDNFRFAAPLLISILAILISLSSLVISIIVSFS